MKQMLIVVGLVIGAAVLTWVVISGSDGDDAITTKSGLKYIDVKVGTGKEAKKDDIVAVHYTGTLKDGKKFDSSLDHNPPEPLVLQLGAGMVIKGWDEGIAGMKEGGVRKLIIPPDLGYGAGGKGPIPGNATLIFEVELVGVK
jgi:peptidylprolyl isomerase